MAPQAFIDLFKDRRLDEIMNDLPRLINDKWLEDYIFLTMLTTDDVIIAHPGIQHIFIAEPEFTFTVVPFFYRDKLRFERGYKYWDDSNEKFATAYNDSVVAGNSVLFEHKDDELHISTTFASTSFNIYRGEKPVPALIFKKTDIKVPVEAVVQYVEN